MNEKVGLVPLFQERRDWAPPPADDENLLGKRDANPPGMSLFELWAEDFRTHDRCLAEPGFWAVALHRFGNWRMGVQPRLLRAPLSLLYRVLFTGIVWGWGIDLCYTVILGRRVRIWHHGGMVLGGRRIGDDVHIRQCTTIGVAHREDPLKKPTIGNRVDIGAGACILGDVTVGDDSVVGANSVVVRSFPPGSTLFGVPARPVGMRTGRSASVSEKKGEQS